MYVQAQISRQRRAIRKADLSNFTLGLCTNERGPIILAVIYRPFACRILLTPQQRSLPSCLFSALDPIAQIPAVWCFHNTLHAWSRVCVFQGAASSQMASIVRPCPWYGFRSPSFHAERVWWNPFPLNAISLKGENISDRFGVFLYRCWCASFGNFLPFDISAFSAAQATRMVSGFCSFSTFKIWENSGFFDVDPKNVNFLVFFLTWILHFCRPFSINRWLDWLIDWLICLYFRFRRW